MSARDRIAARSDEVLRPQPFDDKWGHVVYGRAVWSANQLEDEVLFLQYWLFSQRCLFGPGHWRLEPEPTINMVQLMLTPDGQAVDEVAVTQHGGAEIRHVNQVSTTQRGAPRLYIGRDTGTPMFQPGLQLTRAGRWADWCDGRGVVVTPRLIPLDGPEAGWAQWPGRFGRAPAPCARPYWDEPRVIWRLEKRRGPWAWVDRLLFLFGREMVRHEHKAWERQW